jgi:superfamily I DNA and/or RNA helicase
LNVALTRGRKSLVMVGDAATLSRDKGDVGALLADLTRRGLVFPASALGMPT